MFDIETITIFGNLILHFRLLGVVFFLQRIQFSKTGIRRKFPINMIFGGQLNFNRTYKLACRYYWNISKH